MRKMWERTKSHNGPNMTAEKKKNKAQPNDLANDVIENENLILREDTSGLFTCRQ